MATAQVSWEGAVLLPFNPASSSALFIGSSQFGGSGARERLGNSLCPPLLCPSLATLGYLWNDQEERAVRPGLGCNLPDMKTNCFS